MLMNDQIDEVLNEMSNILVRLIKNPEMLNEIKSNEKGYFAAFKIDGLEDNDVYYLKLAHKKESEIKRKS